MNSDLKKILANLQNSYGQDFFNKIVLSFSSVLNVDYVLIAKIDLNTQISSVVAISAKGNLADSFNYELGNTPCFNVAADSICCYPFDVKNIFPKDQLLIDMAIEGYVGVPLHDSLGNVIGLSAVLTEKSIENQENIITLFEIFAGRIAAEMERIEQNNKLIESEMRLQLAISGSNDGLWDWNLETNDVYYSPRWFGMLGYKEDEFPPTLATWEILVHSDDRDRVLRLISEYIDGKSDAYESKFRMQHKDGYFVDILSRAKFALDKRGNVIQPLRLVGTHVDISQITKLEKEFELIFNGSKDAVAVIDLESNFIRVNDAYPELTGYSKEELLQTSCIAMSSPEDVSHAKDIMNEVAKKGYVKSFEKNCYKKDGSLFTINMALSLMPDKKHIIISTKDITLEKKNRIQMQDNILKLKLAQQELKDAKEIAEKANKSKSSFLANMSHEIRTPMTGMLGFVNRLAKDEKDPKRLKQFNVIKSSGHTLLAIINDILDFSKIESEKLDLEASPYDLCELFESSMDIFASLASSKNVSLHTAIDDKIPTCIVGDATRLKQIIFNLMSNAIKFTNQGGDVTLQVHYEKQEKNIHIAVLDTGIGIANDKLMKIFEAFSQEDVSTTRKFGGTGLGLSISSHLVQLMDSELKVESEVARGSKFYFKLPIEICSENTIKNDTELSVDKGYEFNLKAHILVVEDNKTNQMLMSMILDDLGLTYDIANDGAEGVLSFKLNKYDLILMDENMPIMNGIESTKNIREIEQDESLTPITIIAVTANALKGDKERFIDAGMNDYISKPYTEDDIVTVLQKYL